MRWRFFWAGALTVLAPSAFAQSVGEKVVVIVPDAEIKVRFDAVAKAYLGEWFVIRDMQDEWIEVKKGDKLGFLLRTQVAPSSSATAIFTTLIRRNPYDPAAYNARGIAYDETGDYDRAIADYTQVLRLTPASAATYFNRGVAHGQKRDFDRAIADYNEAIRLDPKNAAAFNNRGTIYRNRGEYAKAIADYDEAIRLDPSSATAHNNRGAAYYFQRDYPKAIADYDQAVKLNPELTQAYNNRGAALKAKLEYAKAVENYNEAIKRSPKDPYAYNNRAWLWATCPNSKFRDAKQAVESAKTSCELTGWSSWDSLGTLAAAYAEEGNFDDAVKWTEKALETAPESEKASLQRRLELFKSKKPFRDGDL